MAIDLRGRLDQLQLERERFWSILDGISADAREVNPSPTEWSTHQIAEHIFRTESTTLRGVEKQLDPANERRDLGPSSRIRFAGLIAALKAPKKFKVPEKAPVFPDGIPYDEMMTDWRSLSERWEVVIASFPPELSNTTIIRHPVVGAITLVQTIQFLAVHSARHFNQLQRTVDLVDRT